VSDPAGDDDDDADHDEEQVQENRPVDGLHAFADPRAAASPAGGENAASARRPCTGGQRHDKSPPEVGLRRRQDLGDRLPLLAVDVREARDRPSGTEQLVESAAEVPPRKPAAAPAAAEAPADGDAVDEDERAQLMRR
jgi:hypothetical protein